MSETVIVALCSMFGTLIGSVAGVLAANKLTNYRIQELEKKVEKHNTIIERTAVLERDNKTLFKYCDQFRERLDELPHAN